MPSGGSTPDVTEPGKGGCYDRPAVGVRRRSRVLSLSLIAGLALAVSIGCGRQAPGGATGTGGGKDASTASTTGPGATGGDTPSADGEGPIWPGAPLEDGSAAGTGPVAGAPRLSWKLPPLARLGTPITNGPRNRKEVALTFDACESVKPAGFDTGIAKILERERVSATVFMGGKWLEHNRQAARRVADNPRLEVGCHSWDHPDLRELSADEIRTQVLRTDALIQEVTGQRPTLFRLPYGTYDAKVLATLRVLRAPIIQWEVVSGDPDPNVSAEAMKREILARAQNGSIVIMHINGRGVHTAEALPGIVRGLRAKGFDLVTVSAMLR